MKKLLFKNLWIASEETRAAFKLQLHPVKTLLIGKNHTGKSTLVKHIYRTLGCETLGKSPKWDSLAISVLEFEFNDNLYLCYRRANIFGLKNLSTGLLRVTSKYTEWSSLISDLFDFKLTLSTHEGKVVNATPPYLFLPFYIDQDGGWTKNWNSFDKLTQFSDWKKPLISYVTGQRPNQYYQAKTKLSQARSEFIDLKNELSAVNAALVRVKSTLQNVNMKINPEQFEKEIEELLKESTILNTAQEEVRSEIFILNTKKQSIRSQVQIARSSLKDLEGDLKYLTDPNTKQTIQCPVCGIDHENGFSVRLELIDDTSQLRKIITELQNDEQKIDAKLGECGSKSKQLESKSREIVSILNTRKGSLILKDVIESQSSYVVEDAFNENIRNLDKSISEKEANIAHYKIEADKYNLPERTKEINELYSERFQAFLSDLGVSDVRDELKSKPDASLTSSGSGLPRTILAYHFAILHTALEKGDVNLFPIVIDSPNQQGQDKEHLSQMLNFIVKKAPNNQQLLLAVEEEPNLEIEGSKVVLNKPYALLDADLYDSVLDEIGAFVKEVNEALTLYILKN